MFVLRRSNATKGEQYYHFVLAERAIRLAYDVRSNLRSIILA